MNPVIIQLKRRKTELLQFGSVMAVSYLFGIMLVLGLCFFAGEKTSAALGTSIALGMAVVLQGFGSVFGFTQEFNMAVSMGQSRRRFVWCYEAVSLLELTAMTAVLYLMCILEKGIYHFIMPEIAQKTDVAVVFQLKYIFPVILGMVTLEMLWQAILLKFGVKGLWAIWAMWMLACLAPGYLVHNEKLKNSIQSCITSLMEMLRGKEILFWSSAGIVVAAAVVGIAWSMLRKQRVTA